MQQIVGLAGLGRGDDDRVKAIGYSYHVGRGKDAQQRRQHGLHQAIVLADPPDVDDDDTIVSEMIARLAKELDRRQVRRDVGQPIGVHADDGVAAVGMGQVVAPIGDDGVEVGRVHLKVLLPHARNFGVNLHPVNGKRAIDGGVLPRHRAASQPDESHAFDSIGSVGWGVKVRGDEKVIPRASGAQLTWAVDGVDALPLVQQ